MYEPYNKKHECNETKLGDEFLDTYLNTLYIGNDNKRKINRIFFNPDNCRYNFIELCYSTKNIIWVVPLNSTYNEDFNEQNPNDFDNNIPLYLGNFLGLNNTHIKMIETFKKIFLKKNNILVVHIGSNLPSQYCFHIHFINDNIYKDEYFTYEQGTKLYALQDIRNISNYIKLKSNYYNNYDINLIQTDKT